MTAAEYFDHWNVVWRRELEHEIPHRGELSLCLGLLGLEGPRIDDPTVPPRGPSLRF